MSLNDIGIAVIGALVGIFLQITWTALQKYLGFKSSHEKLVDGIESIRSVHPRFSEFLEEVQFLSYTKGQVDLFVLLTFLLTILSAIITFGAGSSIVEKGFNWPDIVGVLIAVLATLSFGYVSWRGNKRLNEIDRELEKYKRALLK